MKFLFACYLLFAALIESDSLLAQAYIVKDIKSFGATGNGKTNDHQAFQKAATYFNKRGGNGKLIISKGIYLIGRQAFTAGKAGKAAYEGESALHFTGVKNFKITGTAKTVLRYKDSLRFGAFTPNTGMPYHHGNNMFTTYSYAAFVAMAIYFDRCTNVSVTGLTMDGNNRGFILGGIWGDVGRQLPHFGIYIQNSNNVTIEKVNANHFGLDGICVANKESLQTDSIKIINSSFEYNGRQGLSWIGGNNLVALNCKFNNTGKGPFSSAPAAGVDIEAEVGPVKNGHFINCEFINNTGLGLIAEAGDGRDCTFTNCTFWGTTNWSIWVTKPGFTFNGCNIYGSIVHGYNSPDEKNATKFVACTFEDKPYEGKPPYGNLLIESNNAKRMSFTDCNFIANTKKLLWISMDPNAKMEEKYQFKNCSFVINNSSGAPGDLIGRLGGMALKNCTFQFKNVKDKNRALPFIDYRGGLNIDLGGDKIVHSAEN